MVPEPLSTGTSHEDHLSLVFGALAHPARRHILAQLASGDASVAELAQPFRMTPRAVSKHIGVLERAGLVTRGKDAQKRPSHLDTAALREAHQWLDAYRALWEKRFALIDALLETAQDGGRADGSKRRRSRR
jgi:DNA-binding transcriptional ArsR family regulator